MGAFKVTRILRISPKQFLVVLRTAVKRMEIRKFEAASGRSETRYGVHFLNLKDTGLDR